jgi:hypothetical protein
MELTADAAADEAAEAASEVASGRSGIMDMEPPISEMPWSWASARGARSARRTTRGESILSEVYAWILRLGSAVDAEVGGFDRWLEWKADLC